MKSKGKIAWKTGTSYGNKDAWAIGINGKYVVGVWVGNANGNGRPNLTGCKAAIPIMFALFDILPSKWFDFPIEDFEEVIVCQDTGYRASRNCEKKINVFVPKENSITKLRSRNLSNMNNKNLNEASSTFSAETETIKSMIPNLPNNKKLYKSSSTFCNENRKKIYNDDKKNENYKSSFFYQTIRNPPVCKFHKMLNLDKDMKYIVNSSICNIDEMVQKSWLIFPPTVQYYYKKKNVFYKLPPPFHPQILSSQKNIEIIYPKAYSKIIIPKDFEAKRQKIILHAAHRFPNMKIYWHINDKFIYETKSIHKVSIFLKPGKYDLTLVDESGEKKNQIINIIAGG